MKDSEEYTEKEIKRIRDAAIKRALNTPPKPHKLREEASVEKPKKTVKRKARP